MRGNGFKLREGSFRFDIRKKFAYSESGDTLEQVAQRSCGCPIPAVFKVMLNGDLSNLI